MYDTSSHRGLFCFVKGFVSKGWCLCVIIVSDFFCQISRGAVIFWRIIACLTAETGIGIGIVSCRPARRRVLRVELNA